MRKLWLLALFILLVNFDLILAEEITFLSGSDKLTIISDRAIKKLNEDYLECTGNVIITQKGRSLYGESAIILSESGKISMKGNVRYINGDMNIHGSSLEYNFKKDEVQILDARVVSDNFIIIGKNVIQTNGSNYKATQAEFTTCRDCPESWTLYGNEVKIIRGSYITIKHVYLKLKGIVFLYLPIIIIPIKTDRESGLLPPAVTLDFKNGIDFKLPFYLAIDDHQDMTLTPATWGKRGFGFEGEYRYNYMSHNFFNLNTTYINDKSFFIKNRYYLKYEQHLARSYFNSHLRLEELKDLDILTDLDPSYIATGNEFAKEFFMEYRHPNFNLGLESYFNRNNATTNALGLDDDYIQILPKFNFSFAPYPIFRKGLLGLDFNVSRFAPNTNSTTSLINEATRLSMNPYLQVTLLNNKYFTLSNRFAFNYQSYYLPETRPKSFLKYYYLNELSLSVKLEKIYNLAYLEQINTDNIIWNDIPTVNGNLIGEIPDYNKLYSKKYIERSKNSYKHFQEFNLKYYYNSPLQHQGNDEFYNQLQNYQTIFDYTDFITRQDTLLDELTYAKEIPQDNTLELVWNNLVIEKRAKNHTNTDNLYRHLDYEYQGLFKFNLSQGIKLTPGNPLTRLKINGSLYLKGIDLNYAGYYFYQNKYKIIDIDVSRQFPSFAFSTGLRFNDIPTAKNNYLTAYLKFPITDLFLFDIFYTYDFILNNTPENRLTLQYRPYSNCWILELNRYQIGRDTRYSLNVAISLGANSLAM